MLTLDEHIAETKKITESRKKIGEGVYEHIANLYSDPSHFIFELLQNAEDAYRRHTGFKGEKKVKFELSESGIRILHNGKPFDESDLIGISTFANNQNQKKEDINQIGKFGIGFKSVFSITNTPYIYSNEYNFKLSDYIVLEEQQPSLHLKDYTTMFFLPFKEDASTYYYDIVKAGLEKLDAFSILFLEQVVSIEIKFLSNQLSKLITRNKTSNENEIKVSVNEKEYTFIIFSRNITIENQNTYIKIAYYLKENKITPYSELIKPTLFVYFTTGETTDLEIILHGPFGTTPSREKVHLDLNSSNGIQNNKILNDLASLFIESLYILKEGNLLNVDLWKILPIKDKPNDVIYKIFYKKYLSELQSNAEFIPGINNNHTNINKGILANNKKLLKLISIDDLKILFEKENWISNEITENSNNTGFIWNYLKKDLKIEAIDIEKLIKKINPDFLIEKDDEWMKDFYSLLLEVYEYSELFKQIKGAKIIRTSNGTHIEPYVNGSCNALLYSPDFPDNSKLIKECFLKDEESNKFLIDRLKLQNPDKVDFIINTLLPNYNKNLSKKISRKQNAQDLKHIISILEDKTISREKIELLRNTIKTIPIVYAINAKSKKTELRNPSDTYISNNDNKVFFKNNPKIWYSSVILNQGELEKIGCLREIKIFSRPHMPGTYYIYYVREYSNYIRGIDMFDDQAEIEGLEFALKNINKERSKVIWKTLLRDENYKKIKGIVQKCNNAMFPFDSINPKTTFSRLGLLLTKNKWLYVKNQKVKPSEIYLKDLESKFYEINGSTSVYISEKLEFQHDIKELAEAKGYIVLTKKEYSEYKRYLKEKELHTNVLIEESETPISSNPTIIIENDIEIKHSYSTNSGIFSGNTSSKKEFIDHSDGKPREKRFFQGLELDYLKEGYKLTDKLENQLTFEKDNDKIQIFWCNVENENKTGYDFRILENDVLLKVIELKTTLADQGTPLSLSGAQWDTARDMHLEGNGEKYEVFCVYNADKTNPPTSSITNPYGFHAEKHLKLIEVKFEHQKLK
ncbi:MAG: sacsin N-terminal ATP-binding-like domain-containing protein [Bacteroidales bacterium]